VCILINNNINSYTPISIYPVKRQYVLAKMHFMVNEDTNLSRKRQKMVKELLFNGRSDKPSHTSLCNGEYLDSSSIITLLYARQPGTELRYMSASLCDPLPKKLRV
jgi:hypothetical protein